MIQWDINGIYPLVVCYIAMVKQWPMEIDGLPNLKMVDLSMVMLLMLNNQMVKSIVTIKIHIAIHDWLNHLHCHSEIS